MIRLSLLHAPGQDEVQEPPEPEDEALYITHCSGIMENKMETTIMENQMEKKMENEMEYIASENVGGSLLERPSMVTILFYYYYDY